ncbi:MAG TPA: hypothetical protein VGG23_02090 [Acidimicrobiales bacterium]
MTQPSPPTLQVAAASAHQPVIFEVVGYDAEESVPSVAQSDGWELSQVAVPADEGDWEGPTDVGTASLDVLRAFFAGEHYECPREGCGREHAGTLHCPARDEWGALGRPRWSVTEVERLSAPAASRWVVLVTSGDEAAEELAHARLWTTGTHALFGDDGALYWAADGGRARRFEYHASRGWEQRTDGDSKRNGEVIPLDLGSTPPLDPAAEPNGLHRHAYLLLV